MGSFAGFFIILMVASCWCIIGERVDNKVRGQQQAFNVLHFGAVGDGKADDTQAFSKAWEAVCRGGGGVLGIPKWKTFLLQPINFHGPCNSKSIRIQLSGAIVAPESLNGWKSCPTESWLSFSSVAHLRINGPGTINVMGSAWWAAEKPIIQDGSKTQCDRPQAILFNKCDNLYISGLTHINSPKSHIGINQCDVVWIENVKIIAPEDSPNTDGIDIQDSINVNIHDSFIGTGDDCVAINTGCSNINITNVTCGPGHGISVGSLGANGAYDTVEGVFVKNVTFNGTQNGARIKTWEGGYGYAKKITFKNITLIATKNPIIIDQHYCNGAHNCKNSSNAVKVSDVTFSSFNGTSADDNAIVIDCAWMGCTNIIMERVNIRSSDPKKKTSSICKNAQGKSKSPVVPAMPCLGSKAL